MRSKLVLVAVIGLVWGCAAGVPGDPDTSMSGGAGSGAAGQGGGDDGPFGSGGMPVDGLPSDCGYAAIPTYRAPGALLIVFDRSSSMEEDASGNTPGDSQYDQDTEKWKLTTDAINLVLPGLPQDALVGMLLFPNQSSDDWCSPLPDPTVDVGPLSQTGPAITSLLSGPPGGSVTPLAQALTAGHQYLNTLSVTGQRAVLLVTDGAPSPACGQSGGETADFAASWFAQGQLTFAVGLDGSAANLMSKTAANGGGSNAPGCNPDCCSDLFCSDLATCCHYIAEGSTTQADLVAALEAIAGSFLSSCVFDVPKGEDPSQFDPAFVNVVVAVGDEEPVLVEQGGVGWHYVGGGTDQIVIEEPLCSQILATPSEVQILLGCPTVVR